MSPCFLLSQGSLFRVSLDVFSLMLSFLTDSERVVNKTGTFVVRSKRDANVLIVKLHFDISDKPDAPFLPGGGRPLSL